jgi:hypothetical protein
MNNPNLVEVGKATHWKPGESGNLNGRPPGTRQAFRAFGSNPPTNTQKSGNRWKQLKTHAL